MCTQYALGKYAPEVKRLIYVDTDILFLRPLEDVWAFFEEFNATHIAALTPEHEAPWMGWYNRFARHPYYGEMGKHLHILFHINNMALSVCVFDLCSAHPGRCFVFFLQNLTQHFLSIVACKHIYTKYLLLDCVCQTLTLTFPLDLWYKFAFYCSPII